MSMNGGFVGTFGGSRRSHSNRSGVHNRRVKHKRHNGGCGSGSGGVAATAMEWMPLSVPRVEGMFTAPNPVQSGGHRCSMIHRRSKRTRKAHAGRKSRKHKSRGKKHGMSLKSIFGRS